MYSNKNNLHDLLKSYSNFQPVVDFEPEIEKIIQFNFTEKNKDLAYINFENTDEFSQYISDKLKNESAKFGIGGYEELRTVYSRSELFNNDLSNTIIDEAEEPRRLHLGTDIWGSAGTKVYAPLDGIIHSFAFNDHFGDYGATIILLHRTNELSFYTLYGHVSLKDLENISEGDPISRGQHFAHFGNSSENGYWPPHLHFQIIHHIGSYKGDYPGVCKFSERNKYLTNCPNPDLILDLDQFAIGHESKQKI